MKVSGHLPIDVDDPKKYSPKKNTETRTKNGNPKQLHEKSKPDDGMVELEGGFTMYPSEILDFSEGSDSEFWNK